MTELVDVADLKSAADFSVRVRFPLAAPSIVLAFSFENASVFHTLKSASSTPTSITSMFKRGLPYSADVPDRTGVPRAYWQTAQRPYFEKMKRPCNIRLQRTRIFAIIIMQCAGQSIVRNLPKSGNVRGAAGTAIM